MRKVKQFEVDVITKLEYNEKEFKTYSGPLLFWALHMNIPLTQNRIYRAEFGVQNKNNGAILNERILRFVTPYIFGNKKSFIKEKK